MDRCDSSQYQLVVIGDGPDRGRLVSLAAELGVADRVRWQGEIYEELDIAPWFLSATCFVYPGSIGLGLIHALAYGLPVITHASSECHNPEIAAMRHEHNGLMFAKGSAEDLARQVRRLVSDEGFRARMSEAARHTVRVDFSFERMVERFSKAIELSAELASSRSA
jgi:glycosyltransferase involved in cell wall biosynthesis